MDVRFRDLPGFSNLFLDYIEDWGAALRFYRRAPRLEELVASARETTGDGRFPRSEVAAMLRSQNEAFGSGARTLRNIDAFGRPDSVAIVTGQQLGLFSGPLYTIYKALTVVRLSEELRDRGVEAVPVFWMEGEDHDLAEVSRMTLASPDGSLRTVDCRSILFGEIPASARPVARIRFPETIEGVIAEIEGTFAETRWKTVSSQYLREAYRPGSSFAESFARLMARLFEEHGLVLFDPAEARAKRLASPLCGRAVRDANRIHAELQERNLELAGAGYHAQVSVQENSTVLFCLHEGERRAVQRENGRFSLKGTDESFSLDELARLTGDEPERFSPGVLLRPLVQDHLFPTAAYVAGPAEVAYFAQAAVLYRIFERRMPVIWPRASLTLVEPEIAALMGRHGMVFADCFRPGLGVQEIVVERSGTPDGSRELRALAEEMDRTLEDLRPRLALAQASLAAALDTARRKILYNLEGLRMKFSRFEARQNRALAADSARILSACRPNGNLQERELNVLPFLARQGPGLLARLHDHIDPIRFVHNVVML